MTLRTRIVAALVLSALIPMAVTLAIQLAQSARRADEETGRRRVAALQQTKILLDAERTQASQAADRAAAALAADRGGVTSVLRGPESAARLVAAGLVGRAGLDRVEIVSEGGATLARFDAADAVSGAAELVVRRRVPTDNETLTIVATRDVGAAFLASVAAITSGDARLVLPGGAACAMPAIAVPVTDDKAVCVGVTPAGAEDVRRDILKSFAGVAPAAFLIAVAVGLVLASRIAQPVRALAERAESISAERANPITLLPEKDETRRMTLAFDQMLDALKASERQRLAAERVAAWEEIAKRLAHEIKNPLSPIQLAVENLERTRRLAPAAFDEAFSIETRTILEEVGSLRALVDEFAQFARLPSLRLGVCDPRAIVEQALALFSGRLETMNVRVTVDQASAPTTVCADGEQLGRVLKNVIANALDAMEGTSDRRLAVIVRGEGERVAIVVSDSGRGFDAESLRRVFEPYFTTRADRGGTGLGMAIARRIAVEHGGTLTAAGKAGRGATITLTLPVSGPPAERA